ncbi:hypothetical protein A2W14_06210 [Candidatus Gottesmanbacteria bacterium RBG_16_37_8]|uniref:Uncharacterized protein n=1 Tax=Candidatus Gottesmanbacteria bacterium RBG_16_37_8 TaxID=1798371 RepID=A0A1F5YVN9_9BACT|nr:MAG: hypothetical protein A2W14_06210 [Candidatus Gottesmanbacteria bacterium RBG_16_37_8]
MRERLKNYGWHHEFRPRGLTRGVGLMVIASLFLAGCKALDASNTYQIAVTAPTVELVTPETMVIPSPTVEAVDQGVEIPLVDGIDVDGNPIFNSENLLIYSDGRMVGPDYNPADCTTSEDSSQRKGICVGVNDFAQVTGFDPLEATERVYPNFFLTTAEIVHRECSNSEAIGCTLGEQILFNYEYANSAPFIAHEATHLLLKNISQKEGDRCVIINNGEVSFYMPVVEYPLPLSDLKTTGSGEQVFVEIAVSHEFFPTLAEFAVSMNLAGIPHGDVPTTALDIFSTGEYLYIPGYFINNPPAGEEQVFINFAGIMKDNPDLWQLLFSERPVDFVETIGPDLFQAIRAFHRLIGNEELKPRLLAELPASCK